MDYLCWKAPKILRNMCNGFSNRLGQFLMKKFSNLIDEYLKSCEEQINAWKYQVMEFREVGHIEVKQSHENAAQVINALHW